MAKYNWQKLRQKYITGDYSSLRNFTDRENIPYGLLRQKASGWNKEKRTKNEQKTNIIIDKTIEKQSVSESEINTKHLELYNKAAELIERLMVDDISKNVDMFGNVSDTGLVLHTKLKTALQCIEIAQKGQRLALGMDKPKDDSEEAKDRLCAIVEALNNAGAARKTEDKKDV